MAEKRSGETPRAREMRRLLERWERSGVPLAEYARRRGMAPGTLAWWRYTFRHERSPVEGTPATFVEIGARTLPGRPSLEVVLRTGRTVRVPEGMSAGWVREVVEALEGPC